VIQGMAIGITNESSDRYVQTGKRRLFVLRPYEAVGVQIKKYCSRVGDYTAEEVIDAYVRSVSDHRARQQNGSS